MRRKIILLDFDGVLHSYESGWQGVRNIPDPPVEGMIDWLKSFLYLYCDIPDGEYQLCIYSSRSRQFGGKKAMKKWLLKYGLDYRWIKVIKFPIKKPAAFLTIDDRAICFDGKFESLTDKILSFKTWYEEEKVK